MSGDDNFANLLERVRGGDPDAAAELIRQYEPAIRRSLRLRLDPRLRRTCDSMDLCQEVMCSFFIRTATGQYELNSPEDILKLLIAMARNKLKKAQRNQFRLKRDARRVVATSADEQELPQPVSTPSEQIAAKDLLSQFRHRMSEQEQRLVELRSQGHDWKAVAAELGGNPDAYRKQLARAVTRISQELGLDAVDG